MFAVQRYSRNKGIGIWQILFCLTVLSFLYRAAIPQGYMPDFSGARDGKFAITLCTVGGGTSTLRVDLDQQSPQPPSDDQFDNQNCPFGIVVSQAVIPGGDAPALMGTIVHHPVALPQRNQAQPPLPALGPPLGSRAPPLNLG
jgi:hypothetical protein